MTNRTAQITAIALLSVHAALLAYAATKHSPSIDEVGHIAAGLSHWQFGRFDLYRVNPPLVRLVATAPVALLSPATDWNGYSLLPGTRGEFECGERFIQANGERSFWLFTVARWACIPFSLLGGYVCYRWAGELYGAAGGLLALAQWCFGPNILAHAQMITPDVGAAALGAAACYLFWRWLRRPTWNAAFLTGIAWGVAELTKGTFLILYAVFPLSWLFWRASGRRAGRRPATPCAEDGPSDPSRVNRADWDGHPPHAPRQPAQLALMALLSLYVLNVGYAFEGSLQPLGEFHFISEALGGERDMTHRDTARRNRFAGTALAGFRVPLPANYLLGIDQQKFDFEAGYNSYLRGEWRHGGWWYYYLYGLAIKVPLGTWALFVLAAGVGFVRSAKRSRWNAESGARRPHPGPLPKGEGDKCPRLGARPDVEAVGWRDEFVLLLPAVAILVLVSSQTGFSHHLRYVLPIFPFVFIWIGRIGPHLERAVRELIAAFQRRARKHELQSKSGAANDTPSPQPSPGGRGSKTRASTVVMALAALALVWSIASSLWYYPHSLSYFNELVGGPLGGRWHLLDSNIDWGQDLLYLKEWFDEHPEARPLGLAYFGHFDPRAADIAFVVPPRGAAPPKGETSKRPPVPPTSGADSGPHPGWYAVSVMMLHGYTYAIPDGNGQKSYSDRPYFTYFQRFEPVARAGYSIYIYHLLPADVDQVRRELGLPSLAQTPAGE